MTFILRYGTTSKSLAEWGIENATLTKRNQDVDVLQFTVAVEDVFATPPFAYGVGVQLFRGLTRIYRGTVTDVEVVADAGGESLRVTCQNAWWDLSRIVYQQYRAIQNGTFTGLLSVLTSHVTLGQSVYGHKITINTQIVDVCDYALTRSATLLAAPTITELVVPPLQEARDISCAEAIRRMLAYVPDAVVWFDYSPTIPLMYIERRPGLDEVVIDIAAGTVVGGLPSLRARDDLVPAGVRFTYITQERDPADPDGPLMPRYTFDDAGTPDAAGSIFATIELSLQGGDNPEPVPTGLASQYYAALSTKHWEGQLTLRERECSGLVTVGNVLNLSNGRADWATMDALVQEVSEDLLTGETQVVLGPPEHLGPQDFVALMDRFRLNRPTSDFPESQHNGDAGFGDVPANPEVETPESNPKAGIGGGGPPGASTSAAGLYSTVDLDVCDGGSPKTVRVLGAVIS